jgi:hypothetical protein
VEQSARLREIEDEPIIIASDMRVDSPGHSGLFGSGRTLECCKRYTIIGIMYMCILPGFCDPRIKIPCSICLIVDLVGFFTLY